MTWSCPVLRSRAVLVQFVPASVASPTLPESSFGFVRRSSRFQQRLDRVLQRAPTVLLADASTMVAAGSMGVLDVGVRRFPEVSVRVSLADDVGDLAVLVDLSEEVTPPLESEGPPPLIDIMEVVSRPSWQGGLNDPARLSGQFADVMAPAPSQRQQARCSKGHVPLRGAGASQSSGVHSPQGPLGFFRSSFRRCRGSLCEGIARWRQCLSTSLASFYVILPVFLRTS